MNENYFENVLNSIDFAVAEHEMIFDKFDNPIDYRFIYVNNAFCSNLSLKRENIIGKTVKELYPMTEQHWIDRYGYVVKTGKSSSFVDYSQNLERYFSVYAYKSSNNSFITSFKDITSYIKVSTPEVRDEIITNIFQEGTSAYYEFDLRQKKFEHSDKLKDIIGMDIVTYDDYVNMFTKFNHPADQSRVKKRIKALFAGERNEITMQTRFYHQEKKDYVWISFFAFIEKRYRNVPIVIKGIIKDINQEKKSTFQLEQMNRMLRETRKVANITNFYYSFIDRKFQKSKELDEFLGLENVEHIDDVRNIVHPEDLEIYDRSTNEIQQRKDGIVSNYRILNNGIVRYMQSSIYGEYDEEGKIYGAFGILKDNTEMEESKKEIEYFANHDVLTGLYNRYNFELFNKGLDYEDSIGVFICDVDGLKLINDAFGHLEGDQLLVSLAEILLKRSGTKNVFRIGGDEFVIILKDINEQEMIEIMSQIKKDIKSFQLHSIGFDASIGYSFIHQDKTFEEAFRQAENLMYRRKLTERKSRKSNALSAIMQTMHEKTEETEEHCNRVGKLAIDLLRKSGKKRDYEIEEIKLVADLHDIGKISISDKVLHKPSKLNDEEYDKIKYHSESGYKIISNIIDNEDIAIAVLYHHEKYDGTGYPHGLKGENIPLYSRIIAICDAYDAMTSNRVYRDAMSKKQALKEIQRNVGTQFDPVLVERFLKIVK